MKKSTGKILSLMLIATMTAGMLAGCGGSKTEATAAAAATTAAAAATEAAKPAETTAAATVEKDYSKG